MIFFGWGKRSTTAQLDAGRALVRVWGYFHLFWLFRLSWPKGYLLATATEAGWAQQPVSDAEGASLDPEGRTNLNPWWRFGLLLPVVGVVVTIVLGTLFPGT
ncbi:hypothetical protein [Cellulomonas shaoxiangyii]|uniref:Uncharacterized protein n=1 Tax=Cellulomonas shaoxiangyii TaxID=2566013 RepID=A0A4P7SDU4_9CELL|nr:hypothetical protein [Cellulomonas shaoxiangyii]QCB92239.1 hypothetical protein E5225_00385 [Cellulomonas shaoxiangyii]TGY85949.1 hypothetical protein E5226_04550 [Cellulomonas shaoxiangyii]